MREQQKQECVRDVKDTLRCLAEETDAAEAAVQAGDTAALMRHLQRRQDLIRILQDEKNRTALGHPDLKYLKEQVLERDKALTEQARRLQDQKKKALVSVRQERILQNYTQEKQDTGPVLDIRK